ncbi:DUF1161 domain-containing protein [Pseudorhodoferax sp.]|uniref:DUF1161 domain-containing protein n=1 Tax=Pseudorhodoferax sp. TaxID=1993553 RepID=UPI002DD63F47|nr:DUF1161 domain-containing protein [Pseudorhodoferax sp.]
MKSWLIPFAWLLATGASAADNCEALRGEIEARIRAGGVASFTVAVLDTEQPTSARVVGSCAMGRKKIVYTVHDSPAEPAPARNAAPILTECRDGSTPVDGRCSR